MRDCRPLSRRSVVASVALALVVGPGCVALAQGPLNAKPPFIRGDILETRHEGPNDDLLTAGLGRTGLADPAAPPVSSPPTAAELRRLAIYNNYRALVDITPGGGYGTLYGPNVTAEGVVTDDEGLIPGTEFLAFAGTPQENVTLMVQVPDSFDPTDACIITGPSSGSRGVYGAIATSGEWGLKRGCAVAYTDKGTGIGAHDLERNTVNLITGEREDAGLAGHNSNFTARLSGPARAAYNAETPDRFAWKHAHSQQNPEKNWGRDVLRSIELAFYVLNETFGAPHPSGRKLRTITTENTIVIASSVSNGGGASILAAEQDRKGLIDGIAVSEPNVNPTFDPGFAIRQGEGEPLFEHSRPLIDYVTLLHLFQGCANAAQPTAPLNLTDVLFADLMPSANRCQSLFEKGLLSAADPVEAQAIINAHGILPEQNLVQPSHWWAYVPQAIALTYASTYARASVADRLCGYSFGATDGNSLGTVPGTGDPVPLAAGAEAVLFGTGNGIPPTGGVEIINDASADGPRLDRRSVSASTGRHDENLDGAVCLRALATGEDPVSGAPLTGPARAAHARLAQGVEQIRASGDLKGLPTLIATGRSDAILPPNHTSRAYVGLNQRVEGEGSNLRYYEITNAQHLDAFNAFDGFDVLFVPLHHYFIQVLDLMYDHLRNGTSLPPSQVVHTTPRGGTPGAAPAIVEATNLPPIAADPAQPITFEANILNVPD